MQFGLGDVGPQIAKAFVDLVIQGLSGAIVQELIDVGLVPFLKVPNPSGSPGANAAWEDVFEVSMAVFPILVAAGVMAAPFGDDGERDLWRQGFRVVTVVFVIAISRPVLGLAIDVINAITLQLAPSSYTISVGKGTFDGLGTFFLTANAYLLAAIVMLVSTALVALLLTLRHVIVLFVYIGLPFLAVCWYADWGPLSAVSGFASKVMRMGIYALLVGPLLSIALRALEVISESGLVVAAGNDSLAVLWESLLIAALGPLMLVFITWKLVSWAGEPMGFGAVTNAAAGVTQTALTVAAAGAGAAAGIGGSAVGATGGGAVGGAATGAGGSGALGGSGGAGAVGAGTGAGSSVFGASGTGSGATGTGGGLTTGTANAGTGSGLGTDVPGGLDTPGANGGADGPAGPSPAGEPAAMPGPKAGPMDGRGVSGPTGGSDRVVAADGGAEPLISRSAGTAQPTPGPDRSVSTDQTMRGPQSLATGPSSNAGVSSAASPPDASILETLSAGPTRGPSTAGGTTPVATGRPRSSLGADAGSILAGAGSIGGLGTRSGFSSTALSLASGETTLDQVVADRLGGAGESAGRGASTSTPSDDGGGGLGQDLLSKTATKFTMTHGGGALRKGAAVARDVGTDVAGVVSDEPSRALGGALGGAAGSSMGGPVGTAVGTVVGSEAVRVGASAAMEYGYKQAYRRASNTGIRNIGRNILDKANNWFNLGKSAINTDAPEAKSSIGKGTGNRIGKGIGDYKE